MIRTRHKYRAFAYFATGTLYYAAFAIELLSGMIPRGSSDPTKFYTENPGFFWSYILILFLLFLYQAARGAYLYWSRIRRDTDPVAEQGSFTPRTASIISSAIMIPFGLCFLVLPIVELVKRTAYGGFAFGNHTMANEPLVFWTLFAVQVIIGAFPIVCGALLFIFPPRHIDPAAAFGQPAALANARPPMKTLTKVIIGSALALVVLIGLGAIGVVGGIVYLAKKVDDPELVAKRRQATADGEKFGKSTDQNGCMEKSLTLEDKTNSFDTSGMEFVRSCLENSRPTSDFCVGVPLLLNRNWIEEQCRTGKPDLPGCYTAYLGKIDFCRSDKAKPKK